MPIYAKSAKDGEEKERLAEHTIKDIQAGRVLVGNLPFGVAKKKRIGIDLDATIAFHDIGKAASGFQASLEKGAPKWGRRHEIPSAVAAKSAGVEDVVAFAVITHHKTILSDGLIMYGCLEDKQLPYRNHIYPVWNKMAEEWNSNIDELEEEWRKICIFLNKKDLLSKRLNLNTPLSDSMMQWLDRGIQPKCLSFKQREYASLLRGLTMSADHIMSAGSNMPVKIPILNEYNVTPHTLYSYQTRVGKRKGSVLLQAPTGSGKTEAAIKWAQNNQKRNGRLFYALPTTASINAMYLRIKDSFHDTDNTLVGLLHSRTRSSLYSLFEEDNDLSSRDISLSNQATATTLGSLVREMYFPIRVCTPHQILRYSLQGKGWESMLSEFPNSVFVFDEIHAYNAKLMGLTMATVKYLVSKNATCMFLTATLPKFIRKIIERVIPEISFMKPSYRNVSDRRILEKKRHTLSTLLLTETFFPMLT
jgi:CRISPR-associated endonuclease/helicase Cas3